MKRFEQWDTSKDFWKQFPELLTYEVFSKVSKIKDSSTAMWAIHECEHPKSLIYRDPDKYTLLKKRLGIIPEEKRLKVIEKYRQLVLSIGEMQLVRWKENLDKIYQYAYDADFSTMKVSDIKSLTDIQIKVTKMYDDYENIMEVIRSEEEKVDAKMSLTQLGQI